MASESTEERIVLAALEVIGVSSIDTLTVRDIAARAGVNVATVHYYFGTKERIVSEALRQFFLPVMRQLEASLESGLAPKQKLVNFLEMYTAQFREHPGVFQSLIKVVSAVGAENHGDEQTYQTVLTQAIAGAKDKLVGLIREITGLADEKQLIFQALRTMTSCLHPLLNSGLPGRVFGVDLRDKALWRSYLEGVVASLDAHGPPPAP
jgi:AcrR family transcriptional regulator